MSEKTSQETIVEIRKLYFPPVKSKEYNKQLCNKYPFLTWYGDPLYTGYTEDHLPDYEYTWEDEVPDGWRAAFCPQMWEELKVILEKADYVNEFRFCQIKEKFGTLRLYYNDVPTSIFKEVSDWAMKYDQLSETVCIKCGKPAQYMTLGWLTFVCKDCKSSCHDRAIPTIDLQEYYNDPKVYLKKHEIDKD